MSKDIGEEPPDVPQRLPHIHPRYAAASRPRVTSAISFAMASSDVSEVSRASLPASVGLYFITSACATLCQIGRMICSPLATSRVTSPSSS